MKKNCGRRRHGEELEREIHGALGRMYVLEMTVEHMTGKEGRELTEARNK